MSTTAPQIPAGVVIPAAGSGTRLGGERKQFRQLGGKPLLVQTASIFDRHSEVTSIVLVVPEDEVPAVLEMVTDFGLDKVSSVVAGGTSRQDSVRRGVEALRDIPDAGIVLTHDAVRPFVSEEEVSLLLDAVRTTGAAAVAAPISDTLVRSENGLAGPTVARDGIWRMLTPQGFRLEILKRGHERALVSGETYTDEVTLARAAGAEVRLVEGSLLNFKITRASDWDLAERIWPTWSNQ